MSLRQFCNDIILFTYNNVHTKCVVAACQISPSLLRSSSANKLNKQNFNPISGRGGVLARDLL